MTKAKDGGGEYAVVEDGRIVGHVFKQGSKWNSQIAGCDELVSRFGSSTRQEAFDAFVRAMERGGARIVKLQPAPRPDALVHGEILTQLPYPLHVRSFSGTVLEDWAERVVGFTHDLSRQQVDVWWSDLTADLDDVPQVVGMYVVIQNPGGGYATLDTAVMKVEVSA
jgi:hypothetical protein